MGYSGMMNLNSKVCSEKKKSENKIKDPEKSCRKLKQWLHWTGLEPRDGSLIIWKPPISGGEPTFPSSLVSGHWGWITVTLKWIAKAQSWRTRDRSVTSFEPQVTRKKTISPNLLVQLLLWKREQNAASSPTEWWGIFLIVSPLESLNLHVSHWPTQPSCDSY